MLSLPYRLARALGSPFRWLSGHFHSTIHGDARWMKRAELNRFLSSEHRGLVLAPHRRLSGADSFTNLALVAPTGSGKTTRYVIPNVLQAEGSVVVTDPSGEIFACTSGHLEERGFRIHVLAPADLARSERFNPLAWWRRPQELRQLATLLGMSMKSAAADPFWTTAAINLIYLCLAALKNVEEERFVNLGNLRWLLNHLGGAEATGMNYFMARYLEHDDPQVFSEYLAFCAQDHKVMASILASARAAVELWSDADICRLTATNTLDLSTLRKERTAIYLIVPEHQVRYFGPLLNLFYSACFAHCLSTGDRPEDLPVYFFLDEFGNLGYIHNISSTITTLRKRRCSISLILQELSQLRAVYGPEEARTIFSGGCGNKLFFAGLDLETTQYLEQALGKNTEYDTTFGGIDEHARTVSVPLMSADQIRMLKAEEGILLSGRERPAKLRMPPYYRMPSLRRLAEKAPERLLAAPKDQELQFFDLRANLRLPMEPRVV